MEEDNGWLDKDEADQEEGIGINEYDIISAPNDFNIKTIFDFIQKGTFKLPPFQRHYVWDIKRASKLIESIILGLPIPQIFLFEEVRIKNKFLVVDGQQRLLSIYFFVIGRFPKDEKRIEMRQIYNKDGIIPDEILANDNYFGNFNLRLKKIDPDKRRPLDGLNYKTLTEETRSTFDLRTIRNIILKQSSPEGDSSIYEIFSRLNSGGVNLAAQEIRASLYHSKFYELLAELNRDSQWRKLLASPQLDIRMKDIEVLLRGFAMLENSEKYSSSMTIFLNEFSKQCKSLSDADISYRRKMFASFLKSIASVDPAVFTLKPGRFNITIYEAVFYAICSPAFQKKELVKKDFTTDQLAALKKDDDFLSAIKSQTTNKAKVNLRLKRAKELLPSY